IPAPVLSLALMARFGSQNKGDFANKLLALMRQSFGGHAVNPGGNKVNPGGDRT
nr:6-phosphogluconate dehydrogenase (decarboxylating) [Betaproteobacteria bacterium]